MIRCVIIEDEAKSRETLRGLLNRFCNDVLVALRQEECRRDAKLLKNISLIWYF